MGHTPPSGAPGPDALGLPERATPGMFVAVSYRLSEPDGVELDATRDVPLTTVLGSGRLVPGLEQALIGCVAGDQLDLVLPPEACFGAYDPGGRRALPRAALPDGPPLHAGTQLTAVGDDGAEVPFWVVEPDGDPIVVEFNHPFAGMALRFEVVVLEVRRPTMAELTQSAPTR